MVAVAARARVSVPVLALLPWDRPARACQGRGAKPVRHRTNSERRAGLKEYRPAPSPSATPRLRPAVVSLLSPPSCPPSPCPSELAAPPERSVASMALSARGIKEEPPLAAAPSRSPAPLRLPLPTHMLWCRQWKQYIGSSRSHATPLTPCAQTHAPETQRPRPAHTAASAARAGGADAAVGACRQGGARGHGALGAGRSELSTGGAGGVRIAQS